MDAENTLKREATLPLDALAEAAECLRTLAHPHRLRMVELLLAGDHTVGELAEACGIPQHQASQHLGKMKDRGLLCVERRGRSGYYQVAAEGLHSIMECIRRHYGPADEQD